jgi:hypothetical protein
MRDSLKTCGQLLAQLTIFSDKFRQEEVIQDFLSRISDGIQQFPANPLAV